MQAAAREAGRREIPISESSEHLGLGIVASPSLPSVRPAHLRPSCRPLARGWLQLLQPVGALARLRVLGEEEPQLLWPRHLAEAQPRLVRHVLEPCPHGSRTSLSELEVKARLEAVEPERFEPERIELRERREGTEQSLLGLLEVIPSPVCRPGSAAVLAHRDVVGDVGRLAALLMHLVAEDVDHDTHGVARVKAESSEGVREALQVTNLHGSFVQL